MILSFALVRHRKNNCTDINRQKWDNYLLNTGLFRNKM